MKYLGVWLPKDLTRLASENYDPLLSYIRQDLDRWNLLPFLGLIQRVEIVKMNVLPRILYLFQSLPVEISGKKFAEWDKWISRFLWHGKKPRVRYKTLKVPRDKGGLALPCLKTYYQAAQIKSLINICNPDYSAIWRLIECKYLTMVPLQAIIGDSDLKRHLEDKPNPWLDLSLTTWFKVFKSFWFKEPYSLIRLVAHDTGFTTNRLDANFKLWQERGLNIYMDLLH